MKKITVLIPAFNESESISELHHRLSEIANTNQKYNFEYLFINDGSTDDTVEKINDLAANDERVSLLDLSRNYGKEIAMAAGFDHATGDAVIVIDADLQDPPELIPDMLRYWEEGYDDVYARRANRDGESFLKKLTSKIFYRLLRSSTSVPIQIDTGDFRLLDRKCVEALKEFRESQRYTKGMFSWIGFNKKEIVYNRDRRFAGATKWSYLKLLNLAIDGLTSFTTSPLRLASILGFIVSATAFIYIGYLLIRPLFGIPTGDGYSSIMAAILFLGGVQLISLGIIGEYVARIFNETKDRPLYLIQNYTPGKNNKKI